MPEQPALACVRGVSCPISEKTRAIRVNHALIKRDEAASEFFAIFGEQTDEDGNR